jgi:hypothetical protein
VSREPSQVAAEAAVTAVVIGVLCFLLQPLFGLDRDLGLPIMLGLGMGAVTLWQGRRSRDRSR